MKRIIFFIGFFVLLGVASLVLGGPEKGRTERGENQTKENKISKASATNLIKVERTQEEFLDHSLSVKKIASLPELEHEYREFSEAEIREALKEVEITENKLADYLESDQSIDKDLDDAFKLAVRKRAILTKMLFERITADSVNL